jgi:hypothetical protein
MMNDLKNNATDARSIASRSLKCSVIVTARIADFPSERFFRSATVFSSNWSGYFRSFVVTTLESHPRPRRILVYTSKAGVTKKQLMADTLGQLEK